MDERKRVAEAAERDKENQADLANLFYHELIVLLDCGTQTESCLMVDNDAQTSQTEMTEAVHKLHWFLLLQPPQLCAVYQGHHQQQRLLVLSY